MQYAPPHFIPVKMKHSSCEYTLTGIMENSVDPDQMASSDAVDLDEQCFQKQQINLGSARQGLRKDNLSLAWFYSTSAPAKLKEDKTTTTIMERETQILKKRNLQNDTILV